MLMYSVEQLITESGDKAEQFVINSVIILMARDRV